LSTRQVPAWLTGHGRLYPENSPPGRLYRCIAVLDRPSFRTLSAPPSAPVASMVDLSVVANLRATLAARRGIIVL
jgi:hypothetical protein